jgi:hypothetical protein
MEMGLSISEIVCRLSRYRTTIHREIAGDADADDHAALVWRRRHKPNRDMILRVQWLLLFISRRRRGSPWASS